MILTNLLNAPIHFTAGVGSASVSTTISANGTLEIPDRDVALGMMADVHREVTAGRIKITTPPVQLVSGVAVTHAPGSVLLTVLTANLPDDGDQLIFGAGTDKAVTFEFDTDATGTAGAVLVSLTGLTTAVQYATALATAINANAVLSAQGFYARTPITHPNGAALSIEFPSGVSPTSYVTKSGSLADAELTVTSPTAESNGDGKNVFFDTRTTTAGINVVVTPFRNVAFYLYQLLSSTGAPLTYDGKATSAGGIILLDASGSSSIPAGATLKILALGV